MKEKAYAKINWTLNVCGKRPDGYHELETIMQSISLYDELKIEVANATTVQGGQNLPDYTNMHKAADMYFKAANLSGGVSIKIKQNIPQMAGLGGSSSDAAAVLRALDCHYKAVPYEKLMQIAVKIGADVPFCLQIKPAICKGVGEKITNILSQKYYLLLVKPEEGVATAELFKRLNANNCQSANTKAVADMLKNGYADALSGQLVNALTSSACLILPKIRKILTTLVHQNALAVSMTGSGSCCFGVFDSLQSATQAQEHFKDYFFCKTVHTI